MNLNIGGKLNIGFTEEGNDLVLRITKDQLERIQAYLDRNLPKREPMSDETLNRIISDQCCLTGWKVPPTKQVARAVEQWHGIE